MTQQVKTPTPTQEQEVPYGLRRKKKALKRLANIGLILLVVCLLGIGYFIYNLGKPDTNPAVLPQFIGDSATLTACKADTSAIDIYWKNDQAYEFKADIPACAETGCNFRIHGASLGYSLLINEQTSPKLAMWFNITQLVAFNPGFNPQDKTPFSGFIAPEWWEQKLATEFSSWYRDNSANTNGADMICIHVPGKDEMAQLMSPLGIAWETFNDEADMVAKKGLASSPFDSSASDSLVNQAKTVSLEANCTNMLPSGSVVDEKRAELIAACQEKFANMEVTKEILLDMQNFYSDLIKSGITSIFEESASSNPTIVVPTPTLIPFSQAEEWFEVKTFTFDSAVGFAHSENGWSLYQVSVDGRTLFVNDAIFCVTNSSCTTMTKGSYEGTGKIEVFPAFEDSTGNQYPEHSTLTVWKTRTEGLQIYLGVMPIAGRQLHELEYWFFSQNSASGTPNQADLASIGLTVTSDSSCGYNGTRATDRDGVTACVSDDDPGLCSNPIVMTAVASGSGVVTCTPNAGSAWPYLTICPSGVDINTNIDASQCWSVRWDSLQ